MPIYAYRCESCGFGKDVLQKMSDAPLTQCPECGADAFRKQVTAAGFQLKGSGWYVTDFRGGNSNAGASSKGSDAAAATTGSKPETGSSDSPAATSAPAATPATPAAPAPASGSGGASSSGT